MSKTKRQGVWIPAEIYEDTTLTWTQKLMLVEVSSFCANGRQCYVSNKHLSKFLQVSNSQVVKTLGVLIERGLMERKFIPHEDGDRRILSVAEGVVENTTPISPQSTPPLAPTRTPPTREGLGGGKHGGLQTNTGTTKTITKPTKGRPADVEEVRKYFQELELGFLEGEKFYDWYEQTGWKLKGGNIIKDWKATARNWKRRIHERTKENRGFNGSNFNAETLHNYVTEG